MPEYAGIRSVVDPIDYSKLSGDLIDTIKQTQAKRVARRQELDVVYQDADTGVRETEQFQNQTLSTMVLDGADLVRDQMYKWNQELKKGELKPNEYRSKFNNAQQDWSMFANQAKTYDNIMKHFLERQQPGEDGKIPGSRYEQYMSSVFAGNADLNNTSLQIGEGGKIFMTKYDNKGNIVSNVDVSRMSNPGNMIDNRFDLSGSISAETDLWSPYTVSTGAGWKGFTSIEDVRQNPEYQMAVDTKVQSVLSNNRSTTSVLVDNGVGGYDFYQNASELEEAVSDHVAAARRVFESSGVKISESELEQVAQAKIDRMIQVKYDKTGVMQPLPTVEQYQAARERVISEIEIQLGHDETKKAGWKPTAGGAGSGDGADGEYAVYATINQAWRTGNADQLMALNPKYNIVATKPGEFQVTLIEGQEAVLGRAPAVAGRTITITNARDLAPFMYHTGTKGGDAPLDRFDAEKKAFRKAVGEGQQGSGAYIINGKEYNLNQLVEMGYTSEQVAQYKK